MAESAQSANPQMAVSEVEKRFMSVQSEKTIQTQAAIA